MAEARSGLMAGLAAITMLFAAFTSAYVVRRGFSADWLGLSLPSIAYANLGPLAATSVILAVGRRRGSMINVFLAGGATFGLLACVCQILAWRSASEVGPATAFFRVISGFFLVFLIVGVAALLYRTYRPCGSSISSHLLYWLYLCGLWIYLLIFLSVWS